MDVDPDPQRGETSRGTIYETGYHPPRTGLGTIDEEDLQEYGTPPGTPFDSDYPTQQTGGQPPTDPTEEVYTENFFTPLYTETQETDQTNANANQPPLTHGDTKDAELAAAEAAAATNADDMEAETAAADAADLIARLAAKT